MATPDDLRAAIAGRLLTPDDDGYDEARRVHNGMIDKRPALIARCLGVSDIVAAVGYARDEGLQFSVRGGGHNVGGRGVLVDPERRVAVAQGGATWGDFYRATDIYGLSTNGGVISSTGVAGLTLGGGIGWLMGRGGLSVDNLRAVELVTADGAVVRASADQNPDLFWALRGGGGNFGVAASLEFDLHEVGPTVLGGIVAHPFDAAGEMLRFYRDFTSSGLSDELVVFGGVLHAPDGSGMKIGAMICCHTGSLEQAEADLRPLREFGNPAIDAVGPMSFPAMNTMLDDGFPRGALNYWKSSFVSELTDEAIDTVVDQFSDAPSPMSGVLFEHFHGAATRVAREATAFTHRTPGYNFLVAGQWLEPAETDANVAWVRRYFDAMSPHFRDERYVNYLGDDEGEQAPDAAYGPVYGRLREVKRKYDPENFFHLNQNIMP